MNDRPDFTPEQEKEIAALVAAGWTRADAETIILETTEDVIGGPPPADGN